MATGLMGGTFDPIHIAHLVIAEAALEELDLERVLFIPSAGPPHKPDVVVSPVETRLEMVRLAVADNPEARGLRPRDRCDLPLPTRSTRSVNSGGRSVKTRCSTSSWALTA